MERPLIFVIDDDESVRDAFMLALADTNYIVQAYEDARVAVAQARETRPDLVFLDLKMPGMDGVTALRELLTDDPTLRVYIVTAFAEEYVEQLREARNAGLRFEVASKPLGPDQIQLTAAAILG